MVATLVGFTAWISVKGAMGMLRGLRFGHHAKTLRQGPTPRRRERSLALFVTKTTPGVPRRMASCTPHWSLTPLGGARVAGTSVSSADRHKSDSFELTSIRNTGKKEA
jgi:hypothetical protein